MHPIDGGEDPQIFGYLNTVNSSEFLEQMAPDVHWTLMGTRPLAGDLL